MGQDFPKSDKNVRAYSLNEYRNTVEFIRDKFPVDIIYNLDIDCEVKQDGWRPNMLSKIIKTDGLLKIDKSLEFMIMSTDCPQLYDIYWKVRNVGKEAELRDDIRGQIVKGRSSHGEHSKFRGAHYTECYLVKGNWCVAKARILNLSHYLTLDLIRILHCTRVSTCASYLLLNCIPDLRFSFEQAIEESNLVICQEHN